MKIIGSFIDCVYESYLYKENINDIRMKLINRLPNIRICELASILIIETKYDLYIVKIRTPEFKSNGDIDVEKTHKQIYDSDFIEISKSDYDGLSWKDTVKKTDELIKLGSCVVFKTDIDVDKLL